MSIMFHTTVNSAHRERGERRLTRLAQDRGCGVSPQ
jgi:hypothetical protein